MLSVSGHSQHRALKDVGLYEHVAGYAHERIEEAHVYFDGRRVGGLGLEALDPKGDTTWWMTQPELLRSLDDYARRFSGYELRFGHALDRWT